MTTCRDRKIRIGIRLRSLRALLFLLAALFVVSSLSALAAEGASETVRVGYYENEVFQEGAQPGAVKTGYAYEYYRKLSENTGWNYQYVYGSYSELYQMLLDGEIDLLAGLAWKPDRADLIGYPEAPMGNESYTLVKHSADTAVTSDPATLSGRRIGVLESALAEVLAGFLAENQVEADVVLFQDYAALFAAFDDGRVDILAAEGDGAYGRDEAEVICVFGSSDYYLCVSLRRPDLLAQLNAAQRQLQDEEPNYINSLRAKYYQISVSSRAFSPAEKEWMETHDALRVGCLNHYLPYSDTDPTGHVTGIVQDLIPKLLDSLGISGIRLSYQGYDSYDQMIEDMAADRIDVAFPVGGGLYYSEENGIYQSNPVVSSSTELVFKGEFTDGTTARLAVNENNRMQYYYVRTHFPDAEITLYPSIEDCLEAVQTGEAGATTLNGLRANEILKNRRYRDLSLRQLTHSDDRCFGVKIGDEGLLKLLNRGLNVLGEDYAQNLAYRYADGLYTYSLSDVIRDHMGLFGTLLLAVAAVVITCLVRDARRSAREIHDKELARQALEEKNLALADSREALSDALREAEHANQAKTVFLNNMSHDIRTPMNAIVGFTSLAASHVDNRDLVRDYLGKINISSQHLLSLLNDVLDMSRIESGRMTLEEADVHLPDVIHELRTILQASVTAKRQQLFIETQDVVNEDIVTDRLRLNQVLLNILSNATKFTPSGGTISFRVIEAPSDEPGRTRFQFRIRDNGIGMSDAFQKTIFEAFTRERSTTVSGIKGTGLGMAITKRIVDMMGGTISLHSVEGEGTEFTVTIPCRISQTPASLEPLPELNGLRVLVADNDADTCLSVCAMLRRLGMRPDWTNYGEEALIRARDARAQGDEYRAYILDWMMPDLNGIETVRRLRAENGETEPTVILTAYDWPDLEEPAREAGVTAFCSKPVFLSELRSVLSRSYRIEETEEIPTAGADFTGRRLLLAEDNEMNQMIAVTILEEAGFLVDVAGDGAEAVEKIENAPAGWYDVILMDIQMPTLNGYEAAKRIRAMDDPAKAGIPIVAVTANAFEEDRRTALEAGMNGHLAKPYDIPRIMSILTEMLAGGAE